MSALGLVSKYISHKFQEHLFSWKVLLGSVVSSGHVSVTSLVYNASGCNPYNCENMEVKNNINILRFDWDPGSLPTPKLVPPCLY